MNKKPISVLVAVVILTLAGISLFRPTNASSANEAKLVNLQELEKIAGTGDIEAQLRLIDFYETPSNGRSDYKIREDYWQKKIEPRKATDEYNKTVKKIKEERFAIIKDKEEKWKKKQEEIKALGEKYKNIDPKDKKANDLAIMKGMEIAFDTDKTYSWKVPYTLRYRLTINIETPEGVKSGSAIQEIYYPPADTNNIYNKSNRGIVSGEAVYIDLGKRGIIFAIMPADRDDFLRLITDTFPTVPAFSDNSQYPDLLKHYNDLRNVKADLQPWQYPILIGFKDINAPKTAECVYQIKYLDNRFIHKVETDRLEEFYGEGVKIKNMTLEMTSDPLEWKLDDKLSWIETMDEKEITSALREAVPRVPITNSVAYYIFRQGFKDRAN